MVKGVWLTSECMVEWLREIMLPERRDQLQATGRPNRWPAGLESKLPVSSGDTRGAETPWEAKYHYSCE